MTPAAAARDTTVALLGTPNCGKTTLFNALTGLRHKVANYPGVTVEKKEGRLRGSDDSPVLLDLPGVYSFNDQTPDETVTREILKGECSHTPRPSAVLLVLDGSALDRSLAMAGPALALGLPAAAAVTMFDEVKARGGRLDVAALSRELGIPVVAVVGHRGVGLDALERLMAEPLAWPAPRTAELNGAASRYAWAGRVLSKTLRRRLAEDSVSRKIDRVALHPVAGPILFLAVMAAFFQSIFTWAQPLMDLLSEGFSAAGRAAGNVLPDGVLRAVVVNGLFEGVGSVVSFLPQILILFFLLYLLEDSGYMARAAFLMDRIMGWAGLQGRSFIALVSSTACAIPGIMATRAIPSPRDRLATILVAPFMTCSARLPVYTLMVGAFIPDRPVLGPLRLQGLVLLGLYVLGTLSAFAAAWLLRATVLRGDITPFYMELPSYRLPALRCVASSMLDRAKIFLRRAGNVILGASLVTCVLLSFPRVEPPSEATPAQAASLQLRGSLAGRIGRALEPLTRPLGFDWRINVGLLASLPAREIIVSTLAQIYAAESDAEGEGLRRTLRESRDPSDGRPLMTLPVALSLLAFFVYALQCFSTIAVMRRETNGWRWPAAAFTGMLATAWVAAFLVRHAALQAGL